MEFPKEIKMKKTKYFGHIKRHNNILKTILEGKVEGKRARGRQRYRWEDNIREWTGYSLAECTIKARERGNWRFITANLHSGEGT